MHTRSAIVYSVRTLLAIVMLALVFLPNNESVVAQDGDVFLPLVLDDPQRQLVEDLRVDDVIGQFWNLQRHGDPLAVRVGVGGTDYAPGASIGHCKHYQGVARGAASDGTPYFFLTRNRNQSESCFQGGKEAGELLIVRLGSRDKDGERLRSNRLKPNKSFEDTAPSESDTGVVAVYFDGHVDSRGKVWPKSWHPGGVQLIENTLVIPLECLAFFRDPWCNENGIALIDVSNPEDPWLIHFQEYGIYGIGKGVGVVGVTKDPSTGRYLFAISGGATDWLRFAWSDTTDLRTTNNIALADFEWDKDNLECGGCEWRKWQMLNFVRDRNGNLFLIGADNESFPGLPFPIPNKDYIGLFRVNESKLNATEIQAAITYVGQRHLKVGADPDMGDFDAVSGIYVSPTGQLILYSGDHDGKFKEDVRVILMGEFRNREVSHTGRCGPQFRENHLGGPYTVSEGDYVSINGEVDTVIEPWVLMFEHNTFNESEEGSSLMMDWRDQGKDDFNDFGGGGLDYHLNDKISSFSFCGPVGSTLTLYDDDNFKEGNTKYDPIYGTGVVFSDPDLRNSDFDDEATSVKIEWIPSSAPYAWDTDGDGQFDDNASEAVDFVAGDGPSELAVRMKYDEQIVTTPVIVRNVAPTVDRPTVISPSLTTIDGVRATFDDPGVNDGPFECFINYGDGSPNQQGTIVGNECLGPPHVYMSAGMYSIAVSVTDKDGDTSTNAVTHSGCQNANGINEGDCDVLVNLYVSTGGDNWTRRDNWLATNTPCEWYGVTCLDERVVLLSLPDNNLIGTLPDGPNVKFSDLTKLGGIFMFGNPSLVGNLSVLEGMPQLNEVNLYQNGHTGPVPDLSASANTLNVVWFASNQHTGQIPDLSIFPNLRSVHLGNNDFTGFEGNWIANISTLVNLEFFVIGDNPGLTGSLPANITSLTKLENLALGETQVDCPDDQPAFVQWLQGIESFGGNSNCRLPPP